MLKIKKKDKVIIKKGKDKGKTGEVLKIRPSSGKAVVSKLNVAKKHSRPTGQSQGGVLDVELPVSLANLQLICTKCDQPTKVKFDRLQDGEKVRICKKCGEMIV